MLTINDRISFTIFNSPSHLIPYKLPDSPSPVWCFLILLELACWEEFVRWVGTHIPRMDYLPLWPLSFVFSSEFSRGERCKCSSIQGVLEAKVFSEQLHDRHRLAPKRYRIHWWTIVLSFPGVTGHREEGLYAPRLERITGPSYWWEWRERGPHWELEGECAHSTRSLNFSQLRLSTGNLQSCYYQSYNFWCIA